MHLYHWGICILQVRIQTFHLYAHQHLQTLIPQLIEPMHLLIFMQLFLLYIAYHFCFIITSFFLSLYQFECIDFTFSFNSILFPIHNSPLLSISFYWYGFHYFLHFFVTVILHFHLFSWCFCLHFWNDKLLTFVLNHLSSWHFCFNFILNFFIYSCFFLSNSMFSCTKSLTSSVTSTTVA